MPWNYQIVKYTKKAYDGTEFADVRQETPFYAVHEVYKDEDGKLQSRTMMPESLVFDTLGEEEQDPIMALLKVLDMIRSDIQNFPIIDEEEAEWLGFGDDEEPETIDLGELLSED